MGYSVGISMLGVQYIVGEGDHAMRKALDFVEEYRRKGYPDERIRIIASMRPEPLRSEALRILEANVPTPREVEPPTESVMEAAIIEEPSAPEAATATEAVETIAVNPVAHQPSAAPREFRTLRKELAALRKERQNAAVKLKKARVELERLRAVDSETERLRKTVAEMKEREREFNEAETRRQRRIGELEEALGEKQILLSEMEKMVGEMESSLTKERAECAAAVKRAEELTAQIVEQSERLEGLEDIGQQLAEANASLEEMREAADQFRDRESAKAARLAELESEMNESQSKVDGLLQQLESNEQAVAGLEQKLTSRESELEALRAHFDLEAADLKKRAEQEMWTIQRRLRRMRRSAALGFAVAACLVVGVFFLYSGASRRAAGYAGEVANLNDQLDQRRIADSGTEYVPEARQAEREDAVEEEVVRPRLLPAIIENDGNSIEEQRPDQPVPDEAPETSSDESRVIYHVMQQNEILWDISEKYYGDGTKWEMIARENNIPVAEVRKLKPGTRLRITLPASP